MFVRTASSVIPIAIAAALMVALARCNGRDAATSSAVDPMPISPDHEATAAALPGAPPDHGLQPMERIAVSPGRTEKQGNVAISCPAEGPACVVGVAIDGTVEYETAGGLPSVSLDRPAPGEIAAVLKGLRERSISLALARYAARGPLPGQVTCKALTIDCEGGLGPVHSRSVPRFDYSGFEFIEHRRGVTLAQKPLISSQGDGRVGYRALAGWLEHSHFLVVTLGTTTVSGERPIHPRYYTAYSIGHATRSNPDVTAGATAKWSGTMYGFRISDPDIFIKGDTEITVSNLSGDPSVDVAFTDIRNEETRREIEDMRWSGLKLRDGSFGREPVDATAAHASRHPASVGISGRFYGPNHDEVGGLFSYTNRSAASGRPYPPVTYSGAFGGKRR